MDTKIVAPALLLADDNPAMLLTLVEMLQVGYRVVAALPNGVSVLDNITTLRPDIVILDISLGDLTGFEVARRLKRCGCHAKIIFLTVHEDADFVNAAFDIGASGYVFKSRVTEDLTKAIDIVCHGGQFASNQPSC
jgi:DNA-binding NarL/FixJ family response regulator